MVRVRVRCIPSAGPAQTLNQSALRKRALARASVATSVEKPPGKPNAFALGDPRCDRRGREGLIWCA